MDSNLTIKFSVGARTSALRPWKSVKFPGQSLHHFSHLTLEN